MPQLEFTLWITNCVTNWSIIFIMILMINSSILLPLNVINTNTAQTNNTNETSSNWPW
uniref:ATP synthase complex subunit 8 n=1 Tax=Ophiopholis aculeata TaxID=35052 RepID=Q71S56_OPHAC|nr:ATP synthase F0 subunit 8 [Ophiopholis aculeata]AAR01202.1 ATPase complex subunit 8 [Ophiopholis aculeata]